jgi:predicted HicB family RNase H-like nuclease
LSKKKTTFYIDNELHKAVRIAAIKKEINITQFIESALREKLKKEGFECEEEPEKEQS